MQQKQQQSLLLLFFLCFSFFTTAFGQGSIRFRTVRATPEDSLTFHQQFRAYTLATLNTESVSALLQSQDYHSNLSLEVNDKQFDFTMIAHDVRDANYKLQALTENGIVDYPRSPNKTYFGFTQQGHYDVRVTADEDFFHALIVQAHDVLYIQPARDLVPGAPKNQFVIYWQSDNLKQFDQNLCQVKHIPATEARPTEEHDAVNSDGRNRACKVVQIALADDHLMFNKYGSVQDVEDHNTAVINDVLTNYDFEFNDDLQFTVMTIFVATTAGNDPFTTSTDPGDVLDSFSAWAPAVLESLTMLPVSGVPGILMATLLVWHGWMQYAQASSIMFLKIFLTMPTFCGYCRRMRWDTILEQIMMLQDPLSSWLLRYQIQTIGPQLPSTRSTTISRVSTAWQHAPLLQHRLRTLLQIQLTDVLPCRYSLTT
jgi:hypothetical protein